MCSSDLRPEAVAHMRSSSASLFALRMPIYNFRFNYMKLDPDRYNVWGMAGHRAYFDELGPDAFRQLRFQFFNSAYQYADKGIEVIEHGGWHFGYMGDRDWLLDKAQSFAHQEVNHAEFLQQIDPEASIASGTSWDRSSSDKYVVVELDSYFPRDLVQRPEQYQRYILDNPTTKALDLLPAYPYNS